MASPRHLPVGSAVRAAAAARTVSPCSRNPGLRHVESRRGRSTDRHCKNISGSPQTSLRPGSADHARHAMGGSPRIVMSPLHPRRGARGDGSLGTPNAEEKELREVCQQVAELAPQKFSTVREAFRYLRPDHNGRVSRSQAYYFFRAYGVEGAKASRMFTYFGPSENDDIDGHKFITFFRQQINPEDEADIQAETKNAPTCGSTQSSSTSTSACSVAKIANEFHYLLEEVREKAPQKFSHVREALRIVDVDYDGCITRSEMQNFFRAFGIDEVRSDKLFERIAEGGAGGASYHTFVQVVGPVLDLPGVIAATHPPRTRASRSRPSSVERCLPVLNRPRSPPPFADERVLTSALTADGTTLASSNQDQDSTNVRAAIESPSRLAPAARGRKESPRKQLPEHRSQASPAQFSCRRATSARIRGEPRDSVPSALSPRTRPVRRHGAESEQVAASKNQAHQFKLVNFKPHKPSELFSPAVPPSSGRPGWRPLGIHCEKPIAVVQNAKAKDCTQKQPLQTEINTALTNPKEALTSRGRPVATPFRRLRPVSRDRCQHESA